jgi:hypothetical protein
MNGFHVACVVAAAICVAGAAGALLLPGRPVSVDALEAEIEMVAIGA